VFGPDCGVVSGCSLCRSGNNHITFHRVFVVVVVVVVVVVAAQLGLGKIRVKSIHKFGCKKTAGTSIV
jgi:hypothetical protein